MEDEESNTFKYFCFECKFRSNNKAMYMKHLVKHPQYFSCPICPEKVEDQEDWCRHVLDCIRCENLSIDDYVCNVCKVIYSSSNALKIHKSNHAPNKPFECLVCKYRFPNSDKLENHFKVHRNRGYKCPFCFYIHKNKYTFLTHLRSHTGDTPFACSLCDYRSTSLTAVNAHILTHSNKRDVVCDICHEHFKNTTKLNAHIKIYHKEDGDYKCPKCDKCFKTAWLMTIHHSAVHVTAQPFPCPLCDFTANTTNELRGHLDSHEKLEIFNCSLCSYKTNYNTQLDAHMKKAHLGLFED